jgi:excisionase family DNA binding protein
LLTVREVAAKLRVAPVTIYRAIDRGDLHAYRIGAGYGPLRVPARSLLDYCRPTSDARRER